MAQKKKKGGVSVGKVIAVGAGVAALGAGAYYFLGPKGKAHQKKAKVWMAKMKKDIAGKMKSIKEVTEPLYNKSVDALATTYSREYKEHSAEIKAFAAKLKSEWKGAKKAGKKIVKKAVKKVMKKAAKKVAKKVAKKAKK